MKALKYIKWPILAMLLSGGMCGCKVVETRADWDAFNNATPLTRPVPRQMLLFDMPEHYFFRMNVYWRKVEITPPASKNPKTDTVKHEPQDFTYRWFTTFDRDPNFTKDSLIQNVVLYLFTDGRALLRTVVYPEPLTKRPWKVGWEKTYDLDTSFLHSSKKYVKKNKIKFGSYRMAAGETTRESAKIKIKLYAAVRSKKLNLFGKTKRLKDRQDPITLYVDLFSPRIKEQVVAVDSTKSTIDPHVKRSPVQQKMRSNAWVAPETSNITRSSGRRNTAPLVEPIGVDSLLSRAQIEFIDLKSDIGSNGGEEIKISPSSTFGLGELTNGSPAEMYFRLFKLRK